MGVRRVICETNRLIIREHELSDLPHHHQLMSDPDIMTYIQDIQTHSYDESKDNLEFAIKAALVNDRKYYFFAMTLKDNTYVGSIGFTVLESNTSGGNVEMGYFILKKHWGKGLTTEACKAVISYAFKLGFHKIRTGCMAENRKSEAIMKKLNMTKEGYLRQHVLHDGIWKDRVVYGLLKEDWLEYEL